MLLPNGSVRVIWKLTSNATSLGINFNITLYYQEVGIGDCGVMSGVVNYVPVPQTPTGSLDLASLVSWRVYSLRIEAFGEALNISDRLQKSITTAETG